MIEYLEILVFQRWQLNENFVFEILELFNARLDSNSFGAIGAHNGHFENARHIGQINGYFYFYFTVVCCSVYFH